MLCTGCGKYAAPASSLAFAERTAYLCGPCDRQRIVDPSFAHAVDMCAAIGNIVPKMRKLFGSLGLALPTDADEVFAAVAHIARLAPR